MKPQYQIKWFLKFKIVDLTVIKELKVKKKRLCDILLWGEKVSQVYFLSFYREDSLWLTR